ncbi:hypothetical protein D3C73_1654940 [compost metagenome]
MNQPPKTRADTVYTRPMPAIGTSSREQATVAHAYRMTCRPTCEAFRVTPSIGTSTSS